MTAVDLPTVSTPVQLSHTLSRPVTSAGFGPPPQNLPAQAIRLVGGVPADEALPTAQLARAYGQVFADSAGGAAALQYSVATGIEPLRHWVADREGAASSAVLITNGALHGLSLVFAALLDPGDLVAVESPTFPVALRVLDHYGAQLLPIASEAGHLDLDGFEAQLRSGRVPKLFYVIPDFQNPTGTTLASADRQRLVELAEKYGFVLVSDNPYTELRFKGKPLADLDLGSDRVVHVNTFSKTLGPGLRLGWTVSPPWLRHAQIRLRSNLDQHSSLVTQLAVTRLLSEPGTFDTIVADARELYRVRADTLATGLKEHLGDLVSIPQAEGGIFGWARITDSCLDLAEVRSVANGVGVEFSLGRYFDPARSGLYADSIRLGFSNRSVEELTAGAELIARAVHTVRGRLLR